MDGNRVLNPDEVMSLLGISKDQLDELVAERKIPQYRMGKFVRFFSRDLPKPASAS